MEAIEPMQDHNKEQEPQPNVVLSQSEGAACQPKPGPKPPLEAVSKDALLTGPFQTVLETLADLERDDPKLAFQASRLVGIYRRLWESCVTKHRECDKMIDANLRLKQEGVQLSNERDSLQARHDHQMARLRLFDQALRSSQEQKTGMLIQWSQLPRGDLADLVDVNRSE
ncbi:hypothetical protein N7451_012740 [Penicillium sp. IBT 35674x]|nr:hypothetical protein N7451_012740 [Penicillium sp. IBT 35674x]